ncbi:MAG: Re/Si-specific NAD(P)(+) transhydrogenase subunit alpha [Acidobacteria bacterium]|nr:Re/Si-specific NAD(P)(+) transhydrogenase subunit alpha [Acidobacteriota bacterium]
MVVAVPKESWPGERRVAATPETVAKLVGMGFEVHVESQAGLLAAFADDAYVKAGATIAPDGPGLWASADILLKVQPPSPAEADQLKPGTMLISFLWPGKNKDLIDRLAARKVHAIAMDQVPRITRAQKMDALSSMANIAGYRAVIEAASFYGRFFTGQMTAAGKVPAAKVLVIGAGVAGLAAIGAARSLGAIVRAFDTRAAVKDQVKSMGAEFIELDVHEDGEGVGGYAREMSPAFIKAEMEMFAAQAKDVDIIITTALIPNKPAPKLITEEMVRSMKRGSVIVDLAAENGGNCECTMPGQVVEAHGVHVIGYTDLPSRLAPTASHLYGNNLVHLLTDMGGAKNYRIDEDDEVVRGALVLRDGELKWPPPTKEAPPAPAKPVAKGPVATTPSGGHGKGHGHGAPAAGGGASSAVFALVAAVLLTGLGLVAPGEFLSHFTVFALAVVIGWQVIWNVTPALHTPLMSVTNAISGIILVGGMLQVNGPPGSLMVILGASAILLATINIVGGFMVTQRMLRMFRR